MYVCFAQFGALGRVRAALLPLATAEAHERSLSMEYIQSMEHKKR